MQQLVTMPLESTTFAPFGFVVSSDGRAARSVNQGRAQRLDGFGALTQMPPATKPVVSLYEVTPSTLPLDITMLERHPLSSQLFVPMSGGGALVVVVPSLPDGAPDLPEAKAFVAGPAQAFCYHPGTWHAPLFALDAAGLFTMSMWEAGTARDCEVFLLPAPIQVMGSSRY